MHVAIVTAGGAGMFCGSCMHDNAWARALRESGTDVTLTPLYTPIRVDEPNHTSTRVYYGGINVYLDQNLPGWRWLPRGLTHWLDAPWLLDWATQWGISNDAAKLGAMTVSLLRGSHGPQAAEGQQLVRFLARTLKPDAICFSNVMLCADIERLKAEYRRPVVCTLQGDDVFLDALIEPYRSEVMALLRPIADALDGFIVHSRYYRDHMSAYLQIPPEKFHFLPLGIDCRGHTGRPKPPGSPRTIGYFARIAPEKGLRELVDAALILNQRRQDFRIVAGGDLQPQCRAYYLEVQRRAAPLGERFEYRGSPRTLAEKAALYQTFDVLSVPTPYREPKGLYVLEAWANGVPVVQPAHGHFPELIDAVGGGLCVEPGHAAALADGLDRLLSDEPHRRALAEAGWTNVREKYDLPALAEASAPLWETLGEPGASATGVFIPRDTGR
jgi:glycosyltransferase involved in cell wall biosynthesis